MQNILNLISGIIGWLAFIGMVIYYVFYKRKVHLEAKKNKKINCTKLDTIMSNQLIANDGKLTAEEKVAKINENNTTCLKEVKVIEENSQKEQDAADKQFQSLMEKLLPKIKEEIEKKK